MKWQPFVVATVVLVAGADAAWAQPENIKSAAIKLIQKVGVQGNVSVRQPIDSDVTKGRSLGISIGLSPGEHNGWKYPFAYTIFSEDLHGPTGEPFAVMRTRAILGGIGYGWRFGRLATGTSLQLGYAFISARPESDMARAFDPAAGPVSVDIGNAPLLRPQVKAEYFLTRKFTARVSVDYVWIQPNVVVTTSAGRLENRWNPSNAHANFGVAWYPFHK